ncbi:MAG: class I SAM-dependent methyltransferase [Slackia sp.]|nr:class I SAM-dependent methyltransferase [Slackia sp.]
MSDTLMQEAHDAVEAAGLALEYDDEGLVLREGAMALPSGFGPLAPRIKEQALHRELLVRAARIKGVAEPRGLDATAGLGCDSLLLAAAGFDMTLYERNPVACALLEDALRKAADDARFAHAARRMRAVHGDSIEALKRCRGTFDLVYLDPMFPKKRKSAATNKKFQLIHRIEAPCADEERLLQAAFEAKPRRIVVKRSVKGPYLAGVKPHYSIAGKAVRYDCFSFARPV